MTELVTLDLRFGGSRETVASYLAPTGGDGFVLFEAGPASTLGKLRRAVARAGHDLADLRGVFLTHIHLDHAGAAGALARRTGCKVWVHPAGVAHLLDPAAKLLPSARRIYGWRMPFVWGRMQPVPRDRLVAAEHGVSVRIRDLEVLGLHTPGHARHHISWQIGDAVVTGDIAGVRFPGSDYVRPPTPPPDIDLQLWLESLALVRMLRPQRLLLTHFDAITDVDRHLDQLSSRLRRWGALAREVVGAGGDLAELEERLRALDDGELADAGVPQGLVHRHRRLCPVADNAAGLYRDARRGLD